MIENILLGIAILALTYYIIRFKRRFHAELNVLFDAIFRLENKKVEKDDPVIGEVYHRDKWKKFKSDDISEAHTGYYKILGRWYTYKEILFYDKIYDELKELIENG